jgi:hypothetical protein
MHQLQLLHRPADFIFPSAVVSMNLFKVVVANAVQATHKAAVCSDGLKNMDGTVNDSEPAVPIHPSTMHRNAPTDTCTAVIGNARPGTSVIIFSVME